MYLRIINDTIHYPYSFQQLREAYPNVSFPEFVNDDILAEWGMHDVTPAAKPNDYTKNIIEGTPTLVNGVYYQNWNQTPASETEIANRIESKWWEIREIRNELLAACDWTQLSDVSTETKAIWIEYRQSLRDITSQTNPFSITWPAKP
jgi:hypothetical protein